MTVCAYLCKVDLGSVGFGKKPRFTSKVGFLTVFFKKNVYFCYLAIFYVFVLVAIVQVHIVISL